MEKYLRKPEWIKSVVPVNENFKDLRKLLNKNKIHTVCEEAKCPNLGECWQKRTATIMILGETCTRGCRFCNVKTAKDGKPIDYTEIEKTVEVVEMMGLRYVVITSVDRDDLNDYGSSHFADVIDAVHLKTPDTMVEVLIPDFKGDDICLKKIGEARPYVVAHNIETVERLTSSVRDIKSSYRMSLQVLKFFTDNYPKIPRKSSIMVGLGETIDEIEQTIDDLREVGVELITFGQYLQPTKKHLTVKKYYTPKEFEELKIFAKKRGFKFVVSGPMVRSSYNANEYAKQV